MMDIADKRIYDVVKWVPTVFLPVVIYGPRTSWAMLMMCHCFVLTKARVLLAAHHMVRELRQGCVNVWLL